MRRSHRGREQTLESHIWRLRKLLEPDRQSASSSVLVSDSGGYRLTVRPESADSARFISLAESAAAALSEGIPDRALLLADEALGLWRGVGMSRCLMRCGPCPR